MMHPESRQRAVEVFLDEEGRGACWISENPEVLALYLVITKGLFEEDALDEVQKCIETWQGRKREEVLTARRFMLEKEERLRQLYLATLR